MSNSLLTNPMTSPPLHVDTGVEQTAPLSFADSEIDADTISMMQMSDQSDIRCEPTTNTSCDGEDNLAEAAVPGFSRQNMERISEKMHHLTAAARALEQNDEMTDTRRRKIHKILQKLEVTMEDECSSDTESDATSDESKIHAGESDEGEVQQSLGSQPAQSVPNAEYEFPSKSIELGAESTIVTEADLRKVQANLAATIGSMNLRQQEQKHLHTLTVQKIEAIAQRCIAQESRIQDLLNELSNLRTENQNLGQENDRLISDIEILEREHELKEVTVTAMTSAVAGLEGWIESTTSPARQSISSKHTPNNHPNGRSHTHDHSSSRGTSYSPLRPTPTTNGTIANNNNNTDPRPRRSIVKGRGRFRGRHYIDDPDETFDNNEADSQYSAQDFHDGLKAWIRGFRDVEECASSPAAPSYSYANPRSNSHSRLRSSYSPSRREKVLRPDAVDLSLDEWGDFETPT